MIDNSYIICGGQKEGKTTALKKWCKIKKGVYFDLTSNMSLLHNLRKTTNLSNNICLFVDDIDLFPPSIIEEFEKEKKDRRQILCTATDIKKFIRNCSYEIIDIELSDMIVQLI